MEKIKVILTSLIEIIQFVIYLLSNHNKNK